MQRTDDVMISRRDRSSEAMIETMVARVEDAQGCNPLYVVDRSESAINRIQKLDPLGHHRSFEEGDSSAALGPRSYAESNRGFIASR